MYKTCSYCGIVPENHICPYKQKRKRFRKSSQHDRFRDTIEWQNKRNEIKKRDRYLCRACLAGIVPVIRKFNSEHLEVHHIIKLVQRYDLRLDNSNLITLCMHHHKMADRGEIEADILLSLVENDSPPDLSL